MKFPVGVNKEDGAVVRVVAKVALDLVVLVEDEGKFDSEEVEIDGRDIGEPDGRGVDGGDESITWELDEDISTDKELWLADVTGV